MLIKVGDVNIAGPGYRVIQTSDKSNQQLNVNSSTLECTSSDEDSAKTLNYQVWCRGNGSLDRAHVLKERIEAELRIANASKGHIVFQKKMDDYDVRRELTGGFVEQKDFELEYTRCRTVSLDVTLGIKDSLILSPARASSIGGDWATPASVYRALLVMSNSTMLASPITSNFLSDYGAGLDEFNGSNYARVNVLGRTISGTQHRSADITFPTLGNGARPIAGLVVIRFVIDDTDSDIVGIARYDLFGGQFNPEGLTTTFRVNAKGLFYTVVP